MQSTITMMSPSWSYHARLLENNSLTGTVSTSLGRTSSIVIVYVCRPPREFHDNIFSSADVWGSRVRFLALISAV